MKNYIGALMTFVYLMAHWFIGPWEKTIDLYVAGLLLLITGIPHGAGDHLIAKKIAARHQRSFHLTPFIAYYIAIMVVYALFWYWLPTLALIVFTVSKASSVNPSTISPTVTLFSRSIGRISRGYARVI